MEKLLSRLSFILIMLLACTSLLSAADVTWIGTSGDWDDPNNWDSGTVPTANDHVYITSGSARIYNTANAISADVSAGARLEIHSDGFLRLSDAVDRPALNNAGSVFIIGILKIESVSSPNGKSGKGIYNSNALFIYQNALLRISGIEDYAIDNRAPGFVSNNGTTYIDGLFSHGIYNTGIFRNYRDLSIYPNITNQSYGVHNRGDFRNYKDGHIFIRYGYYGFLNNNGASFDNYGEFSSLDAQNTGIKNYGIIDNHSTGALRSKYALSHGLTNSQNGVINNDQLIECTFSQNTGLRNSGVINNYRSVVLNGYFHMGIYITNGAIFNNFKTLTISPNLSINSLYGTQIRGELINHEAGVIGTSDNIYVVGKLQNHGYMNLSYDGNHTMAAGAEFNNYSVIDDNFDALPTAVYNKKLIINPVSGTMQVGVPFNDVFEVESLDDISLIKWMASPTSNTSVGTYDPNTNSFTPNVHAVGLTTIYITINNGSSQSRNHTLELNTPIQSLKGDDKPQFKFQHPEAGSNAIPEVSIFPNPSAGAISIESEAFEKANTKIQVWSMTGQMIWQEIIPQGNTTQPLQLPNEVANGMYLIHLLQNDRKVGMEKMQILR